jgi:paraquat-inducible protein B
VDDNTLSMPSVRKKRQVAYIWLLPLIALLVGIWLVWRSLLDMGPTITVEFENGDGIVANQTPVKHKGITVGMVRKLRVKDDMSGVLVDVEVDKAVEHKLGGVPKEAQFWLVQPQVSLGGISGINTIFSGNYIGVQLPSTELSSETSTHFVASNMAPLLPDNAPGLRITVAHRPLGFARRRCANIDAPNQGGLCASRCNGSRWQRRRSERVYPAGIRKNGA